MYNRMLKDIVNRYKLLRGHRVQCKIGFDSHGNHVAGAFGQGFSQHDLSEETRLAQRSQIEENMFESVEA